jgi:hypothetical protein
LQDAPKFTQIGIFGLKIYHLATLLALATSGPGRPDSANSRHLGECILGQLQRYNTSNKFVGYFFAEKNVFISTKIDYATFWPIFSQTHLVALAASDLKKNTGGAAAPCIDFIGASVM